MNNQHCRRVFTCIFNPWNAFVYVMCFILLPGKSLEFTTPQEYSVRGVATLHATDYSHLFAQK